MKAFRIIIGILQIIFSIFVASVGVLFIASETIEESVIFDVIKFLIAKIEDLQSLVIDNSSIFGITGLAGGILLLVNSILIFIKGKKFRALSQIFSLIVYMLLVAGIGYCFVNNIDAGFSIILYIVTVALFVANIVLLFYYVIRKEKQDKKAKKEAKTEQVENKPEENKNCNQKADIQGSYVEEILDKTYEDKDIHS